MRFFLCDWSCFFCVLHINRKLFWSKAAVCLSHGKTPLLPSSWSSSFSMWPTRTWSFRGQSHRSIRLDHIHTGTAQECTDQRESDRGEKCMRAIYKNTYHFLYDFHGTEVLLFQTARMWLKMTLDRLWLLVMCHSEKTSDSASLLLISERCATLGQRSVYTNDWTPVRSPSAVFEHEGIWGLQWKTQQCTSG